MPDNTVINNIRADTIAIADSAFINCTGLTSIIIPSSVTSIGMSTFWNCSGLTSITIPASVTSIGSYAFSGYHDTAWLDNQPDGLVYAGKVLYTYKGTMPANTVINNIRADTVAIAGSAFSGCTGLTNVTIPRSVTSIGIYAFGSCSSLANITVDEQNTAYSSVEGVLFNKFRSILIKYPEGKQDDIYSIPSTVTTIGQYAFSESKLANVTIPNGVAYISDYAFSKCKINNIVIPNSVTYIGESAFYECPITNLIIPNSVTTIGQCAFYGNMLLHITIPNSVTTIGSSAFCGHGRLTQITIGSNVDMEYPKVWGDGYYLYFARSYNRNEQKGGTYIYIYSDDYNDEGWKLMVE